MRIARRIALTAAMTCSAALVAGSGIASAATAEPADVETRDVVHGCVRSWWAGGYTDPSGWQRDIIEAVDECSHPITVKANYWGPDGDCVTLYPGGAPVQFIGRTLHPADIYETADC